MSDLEQAVNEDAGSAAAGETHTPEHGTESGAAASGSAAATAREEMVSKRAFLERLEQQKRSYEKRIADYEKKSKQYDEMFSKVNQGIHGMARGFGFIEDEKPKFVDEKTANERFSSLETKLRQEFEEKQLYRTLQSEWKSAAQKHAKYAAIPGFKEAVLAQYQSNPDVELTEVADKIAAEWGKYFAVQQAAEAQEKVAEAGKAKVVKPGGGTGAPTTKEKRGSVGDQVLRRLRGE
jgi:hypothetical protein